LIEEILIRDLGIITEATLPLGPGLTVLTGETGAGKTMVLTALGLLLGDRADSSSVRRGASALSVEGRWQVGGNGNVIAQVEEAAGFIEAGELILSRSVTTDGRSRATVGGRSVPAGVLNEIGSALVVVHGQADQLRLKSAIAQREALDRFGGASISTALAAYQQVFFEHKKVSLELTELRASLANRLQEAEEIRAAVSELERLDPKPNEDQELAELAGRLTHTEELRIAAADAHEQLLTESYDGQDAVSLVGRARKALENAAVHDEKLASQVQSLREIGSTLNEIAAELSGYLASLETESTLSLDEVQNRRAELAVAMRKYGPTLDETISYREGAAKRLLELDSSTDTIDKLAARESALAIELEQASDALTAARKAAAIDLANRVSIELQALAMDGARLHVSIAAAPEPTATGRDQVSLLLESYNGAEPRPLGRGASGGELSRIMLAIEVVLAGSDHAPTFIFDEVDAGVGGEAAIEVGRRLAKLALDAQVIVVTHLPQVAAFANRHLRVEKSSDGEAAATSVEPLLGEHRIGELARMLSGLGDSDSARSHASELLTLAANEFPALHA
jgi:DNA repair protein RecN (Recombination protein N)